MINNTYTSARSATHNENSLLTNQNAVIGSCSIGAYSYDIVPALVGRIVATNKPVLRSIDLENLCRGDAVVAVVVERLRIQQSVVQFRLCIIIQIVRVAKSIHFIDQCLRMKRGI